MRVCNRVGIATLVRFNAFDNAVDAITFGERIA
jgi:hypothetical protein